MPPLFSPPLSDDEVRASFPELTIIRHLGQGGQGTVYLARNAAGESLVIKIYIPTGDVRRIDREIDRLAQVQCAHVVKLLGHGARSIRNSETPFSFVEWVDGPDLTHEKAPMPETEILRLLREVGLGIQALWIARSVHRDLKPANILHAASGRYVIVDLGFAKHLDRSTITRIGAWCGTEGYASPEQANARDGLTFKSDLFSLGIVAYEMALGRHPYGRVQGFVNQASPIRVPNFSDATNRLLSWISKPKPLDRPVTPEQFLQELDRITS